MKAFSSFAILASRYLQGDTTCLNKTANACEAHRKLQSVGSQVGMEFSHRREHHPRPNELAKVCQQFQHHTFHDQVVSPSPPPEHILTLRSDNHDCNIKFESAKVSTISPKATHTFEWGSISFEFGLSGLGEPTASYRALEDPKTKLQFDLKDGTIDIDFSTVSLHETERGWVFGDQVMAQ